MTLATPPAPTAAPAAHARRTRTRPPGAMATPIPRPIDRLIALLTDTICWGSIALYLLIFGTLSLRHYHAYLPHALDLGNMAQAFWNTAHGHPFRFLNMRAPVAVEAFGTSTRLSFHVEPIIPLLTPLYLLHPHVDTLLILQTATIATGAIPARRLARRHLHTPLAEIALPLAYLLNPALEAANLYEFHPVTLAAPLLLWAFDYADQRRYTPFALTAALAMGTKEELGILIALIGLWIALRNRDRRYGAIVAILGLTWSYLALKQIVPHFHTGESSYWARLLPLGYPIPHYPVTPTDILSYWLHHPHDVLADLTSQAKLSYLHRLLIPTGYLALLSPLTLLAALPTATLNLLSHEPHMYSGAAHYSAEIVPVTIVAATLGIEWLAATLAALAMRVPGAAPRTRTRVPDPTHGDPHPAAGHGHPNGDTPHTRTRLPGSTTARARLSAAVILLATLWLLLSTLLNHRLNGYSPVATQYDYPPITAHDRLLDQALALIPPTASVSAQDNINPHLSDRSNIYLYPDTDHGKADYIILDATQPVGSVMRPCDLAVEVTGDPTACDVVIGPLTNRAVPYHSPGQVISDALLLNHHWTIRYADNGILLLQHRRLPNAPLDITLPPAFYTFVTPDPAASDPQGGPPPMRPIAQFGPYLQLQSYTISRRERANLRNPDVVVTTWWRVLAPLPPRARLMHYITDARGSLQFQYDDQQSTDWIPLNRWQPGRIYRVDSYQLTVTTESSGWVDLDLGLTTNDLAYLDISHNQPVRLLTPPTPVTAIVGNRTILKLAHIAAHL